MRSGALAALLLLLPAARAAGAQITLQLTSSAELSRATLRVVVTVTNVGDAAALALRPRLSFGARELLGGSRAALAPRESYETLLALEAPELAPGRWPFRVAVDYTDGNYHPFQVLQAALLSVGQPAPFGLLLDGIQATPLQDRGALRVKLRNAAALPRTARVSLLTSADLEPPEPKSVTLAASAQLDVTLPLGVRTALAGSSYPVYVLVEYDEAGGAHQALLAQALVEVRERRPRLAASLLAASLGLMLAWAVALFFRRVRTPAPR